MIEFLELVMRSEARSVMFVLPHDRPLALFPMLGVDQNNCFDYDSVPVCAEMRGNLRNPSPNSHCLARHKPCPGKAYCRQGYYYIGGFESAVRG